MNLKEERRRFFRIDDTLGICYRELGEQEAKAFARESIHQGSNFDFISNFDNRIQTLIEACRVQAPVAAELVDLLNKKLNFVIQQLDVDTELIKNITFQTRAVNISACGIAFANERYLEAGTVLQLDVLLSPSDLHVVTMATVVACKKMDHDTCCNQRPYYVRIDFTYIHHSDQELLIQHVVKRQSALLIRQRRERDDNEQYQ